MTAPQSPQTVIVTGASSGLGQAIAIAFGKQGANVVINYHNDEEGAKETLEQVEAGGGKGMVVKADVGDEKAVIAMFEACMATYAGIDVLVCNAGLQRDNSFSAMTLEEWQQVINTNLTGQFLCARQAIRYFESKPAADIDQPAIGNIIFMSSVHDIIPWSGHVNYASSKGAIVQLTKSLAQEYAPEVRVNAVAPGWIVTPLSKGLFANEAASGPIMARIPFARWGEAREIADAIVYLASPAASYVTGIVLPIDGGYLTV
ncbi:MAG: SDR family oxidoreductase [Sphingobacteriales bacterium]|nr:MAG: SDR family oxidoreductase [Sphingobacteriales bacterium]